MSIDSENSNNPFNLKGPEAYEGIVTNASLDQSEVKGYSLDEKRPFLKMIKDLFLGRRRRRKLENIGSSEKYNVQENQTNEDMFSQAELDALFSEDNK